MATCAFSDIARFVGIQGQEHFPNLASWAVWVVLGDTSDVGPKKDYAIHNLPEGVTHSPPAEPTMTEGVIYLIPPNLVPECLEELDFREKGGYARGIIEVVEDDTGETHQSLLYRGTPDNPAFWPRATLDLPLAAAIMSVSEGPSGSNVVYLNSLDQFLSDTHSIAAENDDTTSLATMARFFQKNHIFISCLGLEAINTINYFWIDQNMRPCSRTMEKTRIVKMRLSYVHRTFVQILASRCSCLLEVGTLGS